MQINWEAYGKSVVDGSLNLAKDQFIGFLNDVKVEGNSFLTFYSDQIKTYVEEYSNGIISKEQYDSLLLDMKDLIEMQLLKTRLQGKIKIQSILTGMLDIAINSLGVLI